MKKIAFFDLDGTLFRWQLYHELVFELKRQGVFDQETARKLDEALIKWQGKEADWIEYETILIDTMKQHLAGMSVESFETAARNVVEQSGHKIYNYTRHLANRLKADGYFLLAVTGSYQEIAEPFSRRYGFDDCIGALLPRANGKFTSADSERVVYGEKHLRIAEYLKDSEFTLEESFGIGDSDSDISMLELVANPIAFNPSEGLLEVAGERGWHVVIERKNIAYSLEKKDGSYLLAATDSF